MNAIRHIALSAMLLSAAQTTIANTLVITRGPACAGLGKILCNAICSTHSDYAVISQGDIVKGVFHSAFYHFFPEKMEFLQRVMEPNNITGAITYGYIEFNDMVDEASQHKALMYIHEIRESLDNPQYEKTYHLLFQAVNHIVMTNLAYFGACGKNVVWESGVKLTLDEDAAQLKKQFDKVIEVVNYCEPTTMIQQWKDRNENAIAAKNNTERRHIKQVLIGFFEHFVRPATQEEDALIMLTKDDFETLFSDAYDYVTNYSDNNDEQDGIFSRHEFSVNDLMNYKQTLHDRFGFDTTDVVRLVPVVPYDALVTNPYECLFFAQSLQ